MKPLYKVSGSLCTLRNSQEIPNQQTDLCVQEEAGPWPGGILCASLNYSCFFSQVEQMRFGVRLGV